jgi:hypothetical protein
MSYIGNSPTNIAFQTDTFSGTGSTTAFTMSVAPANTTSVLVAVTGVLQDPSTYSVSGTTLTFSAAPPTGTSNISVRYLGIPASGVTTTAYRTVTNTTATAGQTSFTIPSYTVGYIDVFRNGVYLPTTDYTATTGTTVVLNNAATVGDTITTSSFYVSSVLNAIPATANAISLTSATYLSGQLPVANGGTGLSTVPHTVQVFTSGSGTYTSPANVKAIRVTLVGGGGGGGGINGSGAAAGGGGGATALWLYPSGFAAATGYAYAVGASGAGGVNTSASTGSTGGSTTFTIGATTVTAAGGAGGGASLGGTAAGGLGGTATNGTVNIEGGGGGESYGPSLLGGTGGSSTMGGGARQGFGTATAGGNYGGGGAGAVNTAALAGGAGAGGLIIVEEFYV